VPYLDLVALKSTAEARKHGKLRSEARRYTVKDGDVIEILSASSAPGRAAAGGAP